MSGSGAIVLDMGDSKDDLGDRYWYVLYWGVLKWVVGVWVDLFASLLILESCSLLILKPIVF